MIGGRQERAIDEEQIASSHRMVTPLAIAGRIRQSS
jgi:hypothetical protein